jgi:DUF1680 family protein
MLTGESKYMDVLERSLYNAALDGISLQGNTFFYGNPLASIGKNYRREWFGTACCPANIARLIESLGNYIYGYDNKGIWVNQFVGSTTSIGIDRQQVPLKIETEYPWDGKVHIVLSPEKKVSMALHLRIPGWVEGTVIPGNLYQFENDKASAVTITINGKEVAFHMEKGYAVIEREWKKNDVVELYLPMEVKRIIRRKEVKADQDRVALQRGPIVYCIEGVDNDSRAWNIVLPDTSLVIAERKTIALEPVVVLEAEVPVLSISNDGTNVRTEKKKITAIPYYTWSNRGKSEMQVWLPKKIGEVRIVNSE